MARLNLTAATVRRLIAAQFPDWSGLPVEPVKASGWDNLTFRLGADLAVRFPSADRYAPQIEKEQRWLPRLAPLLPIDIPEPLGLGRPDFGYPWHWSIRRWIPGESAGRPMAGETGFARQIAGFLAALHRIDAGSGPVAGPHSLHRGGTLKIYGAQAREAIGRLDDTADAKAATVILDMALATPWQRPAIWVHGDIAPGNLIVRDGRLSAVIDWGNCAVGDPACDLAVAWSYLRGEARSAFRDALSFDEATWDRARGWALWKALILMTGLADGAAAEIDDAPRVLREVLA